MSLFGSLQNILHRFLSDRFFPPVLWLCGRWKNVSDVVFGGCEPSEDSDQSGVTMAKQSQQNANVLAYFHLHLFFIVFFSSSLRTFFLVISSVSSYSSSLHLAFSLSSGFSASLHLSTPQYTQRDRAVLSMIEMFETSVFDVRSAAPFLLCSRPWSAKVE